MLFADDTIFFSSGDDLKIEKKEIVKLKNWFDENKLSLNLKKKLSSWSFLNRNEITMFRCQLMNLLLKECLS